MDHEYSTYFTQCMMPFPQIVDTKTNTNEFLNATTSFMKLLESLGKALAAARYDMIRNVEKITKKYNEDPVKYHYLEDMLMAEKNNGTSFATESLMWLQRGLHCTLEFFEAIINDSESEEDLSAHLLTAYSLTLEKYHGWFVQKCFRMLAKLVPKRNTVLKVMVLEKDIPEEYVIKDMREYMVNLRTCVNHFIEFYGEHNLESDF